MLCIEIGSTSEHAEIGIDQAVARMIMLKFRQHDYGFDDQVKA
jgi:hypothetical protein